MIIYTAGGRIACGRAATQGLRRSAKEGPDQAGNMQLVGRLFLKKESEVPMIAAGLHRPMLLGAARGGLKTPPLAAPGRLVGWQMGERRDSLSLHRRQNKTSHRSQCFCLVFFVGGCEGRGGRV